jgi:hypothetical protein
MSTGRGFGFLQIDGVQALGEPLQDRCKVIVGLNTSPLLEP